MPYDAKTIYELLPAIYRIRDDEQNKALMAISAILASQAQVMEEDIDQLYHNWFIETCDEWVVPYIGDLVGNRTLTEVVHSRRTDVAKTIYYRRRKGTLPILEELTRDVSGWGAHAVTFFELLGWCQNLNHLRYVRSPEPESRDTGPKGFPPYSVDRVGTVNLRNLDALDRLQGPFESSVHTIDVRSARQQEGWYNLKNVGMFLWRLSAYPLEGITPRRAQAAHQYHFSPIGNPTPLFTQPPLETEATQLAEEKHVPGPIRAMAFHNDLGHYYGGGQKSLQLIRDGIPVPPDKIRCMNLKNWTRPPAGQVGVDVLRGRMTFPVGEVPQEDQLEVNFSYGFSRPMGGGPYDRRRWLIQEEQHHRRYVVKTDGILPFHPTLLDAMTAWENDGRPNAVIHIADSRSYTLPTSIKLDADRWLALQADSGQRPLLRTRPGGLNIDVVASPPQSVGNASFVINGVVVEGHFRVRGDLGGLRLVHTTLIPGRRLDQNGEPESDAPSLLVKAESAAGTMINNFLDIDIDHCICGALEVPEHVRSLCLQDSIVEGIRADALEGPDKGEGPPTRMDRVTVFGRVHVKELEASECIFNRTITVVRTQSGCVRFSYVPPNSSAPRRFRCQPNLAGEKAVKDAQTRIPNLGEADQQAIRERIGRSLFPTFTSIRYGDPGYAQLHFNGPPEIAKGAEDGSEMGAFSLLKQPQRETNLKIRLEEYLPLGLEAGLIFVT